MKSGIRISVLVAFSSVVLVACGGISNSAPKQLVVVNHWGGNTGGRGPDQVQGGAISNFIVDIGVLKPSQSGHPEWAPLVITKSYWDETGWGDGGYADGQRVTKGEFFSYPHTDSGWPGIAFDTTTYNGITATIAHPSALINGQQNAEDQGQPLTDYADNLPYVKLSDGRTIKSVAYPTGVAFDDAGRLWVSDNGPDQNFKIFNVPVSDPPTVADTFGVKGGVFAGPTPGKTGYDRFWGLRGVGFGDDGEIIVGTSGIPGQIHGGTDVRAFDKLRKFLWDVKGIFMHSPDIDPTSNGTQIYTAAQRFEMDYAQPPGKSWKQAAVTLDPFRYPGDPRLTYPYNISFVRVIQGKKFLFVSDMSGSGLGVFLFVDRLVFADPTGEVQRHARQFGDRFVARGGRLPALGVEPVRDASREEKGKTQNSR